MLKSVVQKLKDLFTKKKSPIPFAEYSQSKLVDGDPKSVKPKDPSPKKTVTNKSKQQPKSVNNQPKKRKKPWALTQYPIPKAEGKIRFHDLGLSTSVMHAIADLKFQYCSPIQAGILPDAIKGTDAIGKAQTGTGKSAAFIITIISRLQKNPIKGGPTKGHPRALVLAPTRELAVQIEKDTLELIKYTPYKVISIFGGMGYEKQKTLLKSKSYDIIIATPGRLIDFCYQKLIKLNKIEILVLDEADRMLDMGFIPDVRKIIYQTPHKNKRQTMFYSATFSPEVSRLAEQWTNDSVFVDIEPETIATKTVQQLVYLTTNDEKFTLLYNMLKDSDVDKVLIFTNRRDEARSLNTELQKYNFKSALISGEVHQKKRMSALEAFRSGKTPILVATDVAGRGIHIDAISHVINYHLPEEPENYVHRIGRTGRAGASGISISFASEDDSFQIPDIEKFLGDKLICQYPDDYLLATLPKPPKKPEVKQQQKKTQSKPRNYKKKNNYKGKKNYPSKNKTNEK